MIKEIWNEVFVKTFYESWCTKKGWGRFFLVAPVVYLFVLNDVNIWATVAMAVVMSWGIDWVTGDRDEN